LEEIHASEGLEFYMRIQKEWKSLDFVSDDVQNQQKLKSLARSLYDTFISENGPKSLSLDVPYTRHQLETTIGQNNFSANLFDVVADSIVGQLTSHMIAYKLKYKK
jgi:hypothetical protein